MGEAKSSRAYNAVWRHGETGEGRRVDRRRTGTRRYTNHSQPQAVLAGESYICVCLCAREEGNGGSFCSLFAPASHCPRDCVHAACWEATPSRHAGGVRRSSTLGCSSSKTTALGRPGTRMHRQCSRSGVIHYAPSAGEETRGQVGDRETSRFACCMALRPREASARGLFGLIAKLLVAHLCRERRRPVGVLTHRATMSWSRDQHVGVT